jgi:hypothetical protein
MTITALPTGTTARWEAATETLRDAAVAADHPLASQHAEDAERQLLASGQPTTAWANRLAAIAVIAGRRAESAPTIERRVAYLDLAAAATELLMLARNIHGTRPDGAALRILADTGLRSAALI